MFVLAKQEYALFRGIATLVTIALVLWVAGTAFVKVANADNVTDVYDLLSTSATSTPANHTIEFVSPTGVANGQTITLTFDSAGSNFTGVAGIDTNDVDLLVNGVAEDIEGGDWTVGAVGQTITLTNVVGSIPANATTTILIGLHATNEGVPDEQITNPATQGSYIIDITAGTSDSGATQIAIVDSVYVTASVDTQFDFTVIGFTTQTGTAVNGTSTTGTTTATTLPFGTLTAGNIETLAQVLNVETNAINGYVVTVEVDHQLESSTGADIDSFADGGDDDTPGVWTRPGGGTPNIANENEWGHWGMTTSDDDIHGNGTDFSANNTWIALSTSPRAIMAHDGPADGLTGSDTIAGGDDIGSTTVGYQVEISSLQEAADDYEAILTYIATPTF